MKNQNGFSLVEGLLIVLIISVLGFAGFYVWNQQKEDEIEQTETRQQHIQENKVDENTQNKENAELYSIELDNSKSPNIREVSYADFLVIDRGGGAMGYDVSSGRFITGELNSTGQITSSIANAEAATTASDGTPIFLKQSGDADTYTDTYAIDLKNETILQITFIYSSYDDGVYRAENYMTPEEIEVQRGVDLSAVKTFKFN